MTAPTLLFCIGATKSGTSWLHRALRAHPECYFRAVKEVHFFDGIDEGTRAAHAAELRAALARRIAAAEDPGLTLAQAARRSAEAVDMEDCLTLLEAPAPDTAAYLAYLGADRDDVRVIGDVTPAYALLGAERLAAMARLLPDVRFVYLMRDPVARLWSHVRMIARRRAGDVAEIPARASHILSQVLTGGETQIARRGDYAGALARLFSAVAPDRRLVLFFEDLFGAGALARLAAFLGLATAPVPAAARVHAGHPVEMSPEQRHRAARWLAPQYDEVARRMGPLPAAWQRSMAEV